MMRSYFSFLLEVIVLFWEVWREGVGVEKRGKEGGCVCDE